MYVTQDIAPRPSRLRRLVQRLRWRIADTRRITVRLSGRDGVRVSRVRGIGSRFYRVADPEVQHVIRAGRLRLLLPDPAALVRLAISGLLTGQVRRVEVRLDCVPEWLLVGLRSPRLTRTTTRVRWRRRGERLTLELRWSKPCGVHRALDDVISMVLRARPWDQVSGPVYLLDRGVWLAGAASWPQGQLAPGPPVVETDTLSRPLGPYLSPDPPAHALPAPLVTAVANPFGRRLVGAAKPYRLVSERDRIVLRDDTGQAVLRLDRESALSVEGATARADLAKYAVVTVDQLPTGDPLSAELLRTLAALGMVFAAPEAAVRSALDELDVVSVGDAKEVDDLRGYALSIEASRRMAIAGDAALRRTALADGGALPLPAVSVVLSSMRSDHVENCLGFLTRQTYPEIEVLVGLHGYELPEQTRARWRDMLPFPVRVVSFPEDLTFGAVLGRLSRMADGELLTKMDDDDRYGPNHVTDLVIAWHTTGADVAAKGSRFVHFPETGETIDRAWTAVEQFNVTPAGGTLLMARSTLQQFGGWSHSSKHVDTDLLIRIKSAGGVVYRSHGLEYVYVRRTAGHTWATEIDTLVQQGERVYEGLPAEIINPEPVSLPAGLHGHEPGGRG